MLSLIKSSQFRGEQNIILCPVDQKEKWNTFQHFARIFSKFTSFSESQKQTLWHRKSYSFSHVQPKRTKKGLLYNKIVTKSPQDLCWHAGIALSAAVVFASDRYVFVLLGSVWCRDCPRRALKSTIQDPKCQSTSPQPFRATKPTDSTKMASLAFFVLQSASYKWPHSTPVWLLTALWILLPERTGAKKYTLLWGRGLGHSVSAFRLCVNNLKGFHLDSKFFFGCQRVEKLLNWKLLGRRGGGASAKLPKHYGTLLKHPVDENWISVLINDLIQMKCVILGSFFN